MTSMLDRRPGHAVIEAVLHEQSLAVPRTRLDVLFGLNALAPAARPWYAGALGELHVGQILASLPPTWKVFHALPVGTQTTDIDHLVVGPGGVFPVNTKHHRGQKIWLGERMVMVAGQRTDYIRNSVSEGRRVAKLVGKLGVEAGNVRPVICLVSPGPVTIRQRPAGVSVATDGELYQFLIRQPQRLDALTVARIAQLFDNPGTWRTLPASHDPYPVFEQLRKDVERANTRRALWSLALAGAAVAGFFGMYSVLLGH
ncbi:nuclease-related domain-containing protein [Leifsonia sp. EB34]|uniref:nuclease-related domain-containing protein n=1 Tax=Leifsonia sp. EB34 TaxID=3156303 RepID=UPI0035185D99